MDEDEVLRVIDQLTAAGIRVWLDGGWGVDALVGRHTRRHDDLDLALPLVDVERALGVLAAMGYHLVEDELPTRADLRTDDDRRVDLHPLTFDTDGNGLQQLPDGSVGTYTADGLRCEGTIAGRRVDCLTPDPQIRFHLGYPPDDNDHHDVRLLAERFGLPLPSEYRASASDRSAGRRHDDKSLQGPGRSQPRLSLRRPWRARDLGCPDLSIH